MDDTPLILIVDDDRLTRTHLRRRLESEGYQVEEAEDGRQALEAYARLRPDVVLLDIIMPIMDGFACCAQLQKLQMSGMSDPTQTHGFAQKTQDYLMVSTPVLMITALEDQQSVDQAFEVGAVDYFTKPIHWALLRCRVRRLIQQGQLYRQLEDTNQKLEEVNQMLQRLASVDGLTQVANRRCFDEMLIYQWQSTSREQEPLSLIFVDIDYFKRYNDTYGHLAGDKCLKQVAQALSKTMGRPTDLVARYGGEEFVMLLPGINLAGANQVAEAIQAAMKRLDVAHASSPLGAKMTLSLGISCLYPSQHSSPITLIKLADKALYLAKESGRDRICTLTP
ncbi:MAG: PleD family two-component system response regulator [Leptolyngbyaceae cyanobacterium CSU_1_4]|nr:PleD family two-component system response regulator [Leptolyngbyaceae cyanobacterium CSU_1_4]